MKSCRSSCSDMLYLRRHAPFLIAFEERAQVFQTVIAADRDRRREMGAYGPQTFVTIHRDTLMQVQIFPRISLYIFPNISDVACPGKNSVL